MTIDHPDYQALVARILAQPDNDAPRLVAADWLEENAGDVECPACKGEMILSAEPPGGGSPCRNKINRVIGWWCPDCEGVGRVPNGFAERAEFIRCQIEILRLRMQGTPAVYYPEEPEAPDRLQALRKRERDLLDQHWSAWIRGAGLVPDGWKLSTDGDSFHVWRDDPFNDGYRFQFRRGFVDEIRCPLRLWMGEECKAVGPHHGDRCDGGRVQSPNAQFTQDCPVCHGLGTTVGIGPELVKQCPLTRVTLTDREPEWDDSLPGWIRDDDSDPDAAGRPDTIPPEMFDMMAGGEICVDSVTWTKFPTRQAALDALSAACLGWARDGVPSHG